MPTEKRAQKKRLSPDLIANINRLTTFLPITVHSPRQVRPVAGIREIIHESSALGPIRLFWWKLAIVSGVFPEGGRDAVQVRECRTLAIPECTIRNRVFKIIFRDFGRRENSPAMKREN